MNISKGGKFEQRTNGQSNDFERVDNSARQNQVMDNNIAEQITRADSSAGRDFDSHRLCDYVVIARVEMVVKLITGLTGHGTNGGISSGILETPRSCRPQAGWI